MYGFSKTTLENFGNREQGVLERTESIEMLRWIENGEILESKLLDTPSISVDTPEDLIEAEELIKSDTNKF